MHPELFRVGPFVIHSYGLMIAAGFAAGAWWLVRRGVERGLSRKRLLDLVTAIIISGLLGARILYVVTHWTHFAGTWWRILWPVQTDGTIGIHGLVFYGGVLSAVPVAVWLVRRWELKPLKVLDAVAPPLALGTAVGRIGCFLNGCCFGKPTSCPWGVTFPEQSLAGSTFPGVLLHPTQLYMVADNLVIVAVLLLIERRWPKFDGIVFGAYLVSIGLARAVEDLFRYYENSMRLFTAGGIVVTVNQLIGLVLIPVGVLIIFWSRSQNSDPLV